MALNDNTYSSFNGGGQTTINGERIKEKTRTHEVEDMERHENSRPAVRLHRGIPTQTSQKKKKNLSTPIALVIFCLLFVGCFIAKDIMEMPYGFNKSLPVTLVTVDDGDFNLTIQGDDRYENVLDMVRGDYYKYQSKRFIEDAHTQKKQYGDKILNGTRFNCKPLSGKGVINIQHTTTQGSAGIAVVFGKNNGWGVICEEWYKKVQFGLNHIKIEELRANEDETVPDITLQFTHFPNKYKKNYEEMEMQIWIKDNQQANISLEQISDNEYAIASTAPILQIDINGNIIKDVGTQYVYKIS